MATTPTPRLTIGGKPNKGTRPDKRLKENKPGRRKGGGKKK
jgi:hypothetical protein